MASVVVKSVVEKLGKALVEEAEYLYDVSDRIQSLQTELEWMECFLLDAEKMEHQNKLIGKWVSQVRDFALEAEDIIERYVHKVSHPRKIGFRNTLKWVSCVVGSCECWSLHTIGCSIDDLRSRIFELSTRLHTYGAPLIGPTDNFTYNAMIPEEWPTYSSGSSSGGAEEHKIMVVVGLDQHVKTLVDQLMNPRANVLGICGVPGLGKTTLANEVFQHREIKRGFDKYLWLQLSAQFHPRTVWKEILRGLSENDDVTHIKSLRDDELPIIINELLKARKCLFVIDGIRCPEDWDELKQSFESIIGSPSKILVTTRDPNVLYSVYSGAYSHPFGVLSDEDSWLLTKMKARLEQKFKDEEMKAGIEALGKEMVKQFKGLPAAIVALGGILATKHTIQEWESVKNHIISYMRSDIGRASRNGGASFVLELSYYDLPSHLKPCFLCMGNFPENYEIPTQRLYHLWEAEGLLATSIKDEVESGGVTTYEIAERYLSELIQRCMVQLGRCWASGRIKTCRLYGFARDMCVRKCKKVNFLNVVAYSPSRTSVDSLQKKELRRCALCVEDYAFLRQFGWHKERAPNCRSLFVFLEAEDPDFAVLNLPSFPLLRTLDLEGTKISELPEGVGRLIHLRYFSLKRTSVAYLPSSFWGLKYLETLDLRCWGVLMKLLNKFHNMKRLKHLYLPLSYTVVGSSSLRLSFIPLQIETLKNFDPELCGMEDLLRMKNLRVFSVTTSTELSHSVLKGLFKSPALSSGRLLNSLHLKMSAQVINEDTTILSIPQGQSSIHKLDLFGKRSVSYHNIGNAIDFIDGHQVFPRGLTHLYLYHCEIGMKCISVLGKQLPGLKLLPWKGSVITVNKAMSFSPGSFPQLQEFFLVHLFELEKLEVREGAFPNLRYMQIFGCHMLKMLPNGLPDSINIECKNPCINGIDKYNTCPHFKAAEVENNVLSSSA